MEVCPYHNIEPNVESFVAREGIEETYIDKDGRTRKYALPKLVIYKMFCPECAALRKWNGVQKRFGKGWSAHSRRAVELKWNNACADERLKIFKTTIKTGC